MLSNKRKALDALALELPRVSAKQRKLEVKVLPYDPICADEVQPLKLLLAETLRSNLSLPSLIVDYLHLPLERECLPFAQYADLKTQFATYTQSWTKDTPILLCLNANDNWGLALFHRVFNAIRSDDGNGATLMQEFFGNRPNPPADIQSLTGHRDCKGSNRRYCQCEEFDEPDVKEFNEIIRHWNKYRLKHPDKMVNLPIVRKYLTADHSLTSTIETYTLFRFKYGGQTFIVVHTETHAESERVIHSLLNRSPDPLWKIHHGIIICDDFSESPKVHSRQCGWLVADKQRTCNPIHFGDLLFAMGFKHAPDSCLSDAMLQRWYEKESDKVEDDDARVLDLEETSDTQMATGIKSLPYYSPLIRST